MFPRNSVAVVSFAVWEEGIVTARGNPKAIRAVEDFARPDVTMVNREAGAGQPEAAGCPFGTPANRAVQRSRLPGGGSRTFAGSMAGADGRGGLLHRYPRGGPAIRTEVRPPGERALRLGHPPAAPGTSGNPGTAGCLEPLAVPAGARQPGRLRYPDGRTALAVNREPRINGHE